MNIELKEITITELSDGFQDNAENGIIGFNGNLDIRPPYQREFIYKDKQRDAVINTITKNFPLNVMYWAVNEDGTNKLTIYYPFDRYYMEESKAYDAELVYTKSLQDTTQVTYALVSIKDGDAVLKDVLIDEISIKEIVKEKQKK